MAKSLITYCKDNNISLTSEDIKMESYEDLQEEYDVILQKVATELAEIVQNEELNNINYDEDDFFGEQELTLDLLNSASNMAKGLLTYYKANRDSFKININNYEILEAEYKDFVEDFKDELAELIEEYNFPIEDIDAFFAGDNNILSESTSIINMIDDLAANDDYYDDPDKMTLGDYSDLLDEFAHYIHI
ncbi:MAG: hypothetical protein HRU35_01880 [Rickettsiaceae bacterium]|nr:hypothetical protein [Rickettsiaceae bacterium]